MKQFNYNPFTWEPKDNERYYHIRHNRVDWCRAYDSVQDEGIKDTMGRYKTEEDAKLALEIAREAILKNVKE